MQALEMPRFILLLIVGLLLYNIDSATSLNDANWNITCEPHRVLVLMYKSVNVTCTITGPENVYSEHDLLVESNKPEIARVKSTSWLKKDTGTTYFPESFTVHGVFIGDANVSIFIKQRGITTYEAVDHISVVVTREKTTLDTIFHVSVIILVSLMYINFGCAFSWGELKKNLRKPIAPCLGFGIQIIFMPLISFTLGRILFPGNVPMQLGLFFTGIAPSGGASNMWTLILGGNIDLSITLTAMSNIAAFATMPLWAFTLGPVIYDEGNMEVPYKMLSYFAVCLIVPLLIGYVIQTFCPKVSRFLVRILKGLSGALLAFIIIFAIITNTYIFELFSWQIVLAGMGLPWIGYTTAYLFTKLCGRDNTDALTIAIETGIQNTGIPIYLLKNTLKQPTSDLTTVVPVTVAMMIPFPLLGLYLYQVIKKRMQNKECEKDFGRQLIVDNSPTNSPMTELLVDNDNNFNVTGPTKNQAKLKLDDNYFTTMDLQCNI